METISIIWWTILLEFVYADHADRCSCDSRRQQLTCFKHLPKLVEKFPRDVKILELRNLQLDELDLKYMLHKFPAIENISIFQGDINRIIFPKPENNITVLQLVDVGVENIGNRFLSNFPKLETLNLKRNYLQSLPNNFSLSNLKNLYLADNRWNCSKNLDWLDLLNQTVVKDLQNLTCFGSPHSNKPLLTIASFIKAAQEQCPSDCICSLPKVVFKGIDSEQLEPVIEVNCSFRGLTELPPDLPLNTKIIHLEDNVIEDLRPVKYNVRYQKVLDLHLDNNKVRSIEELEGSYWLKHFRVLSLSGNKLTEIPTYVLDNALEQNVNMPNAVRINLGGNPWRCDCVFTPIFQEMLQKFAPQIQDTNEIKCSYVEGDENSLLPIIELSRNSVCRSPTEYSVQSLDLLNAVLASLILLVLGKLAYDYYYYKKTGRLPWIVTKIP